MLRLIFVAIVVLETYKAHKDNSVLTWTPFFRRVETADSDLTKKSSVIPASSLIEIQKKQCMYVSNLFSRRLLAVSSKALMRYRCEYHDLIGPTSKA